MASLSKTKIGYCIRLSKAEANSRPRINLGKCKKSEAMTAQANIENILRSKRTGWEIPPKTADWILNLPDGLRTRLEELKLIKPREEKIGPTLKEYVAGYIKKRTHVKADTIRKWENVQGKLNAFFKDAKIDTITLGDAEDFQNYLKGKLKLSDNTVRRSMGLTRQFFNAAVRDEIITKNPFKDKSLPVGVRPNKARFFFVTPEMARKVLDACPDAQWRLIFGLARFGGLRCPSEVLRLKWEDVLWDTDEFIVHSSKTEHHADGGIRKVPMFPELKPLFQDAFDQAKEGAVYCLDKYNGQWSNLGTHMKRIVKKAGLKPWPKLFQNCRSTRETELMKEFPIHEVCEYIGNSPQIAMAHYAQVTDDDRKRAAQYRTPTKPDEKVGLNLGLNSGETECKTMQGDNESNDVNPDDCTTLDEFALSCTSPQNDTHWALEDLNLKM